MIGSSTLRGPPTLRLETNCGYIALSLTGKELSQTFLLLLAVTHGSRMLSLVIFLMLFFNPIDPIVQNFMVTTGEDEGKRIVAQNFPVTSQSTCSNLCVFLVTEWETFINYLTCVGYLR